MQVTDQDAPTRPELLNAYLVALDRLDAANAAAAEARKIADYCESKVRADLEATGEWQAGHGVKAPGISVNVQQKWRARYDPEQWPAIVEWAAQNKMSHLVQRRLNDKGCLELVDSGTPLPSGLTMESFLDLSFRRG